MIKIIFDNNKFTIKGSFNLGYMGIYRDHQVKISDTLDDIREWDIIMQNLPQDLSDEDIIEFLNQYFNDFEQKIQLHIKQVNDNFLLYVFEDMEECGNEFWSIPELTIQSAMPDNPEEEIYPPHWDLMNQLDQEYRNRPNDGTIPKTDVENALRQNYPMFHLDKLISSIVSEYLYLSDGEISFQCSDGIGDSILCGAYDVLNEQLEFTDWHNF